jgi:hypothetical protein
VPLLIAESSHSNLLSPLQHRLAQVAASQSSHGVASMLSHIAPAVPGYCKLTHCRIPGPTCLTFLKMVIRLMRRLWRFEASILHRLHSLGASLTSLSVGNIDGVFGPNNDGTKAAS